MATASTAEQTKPSPKGSPTASKSSSPATSPQIGGPAGPKSGRIASKKRDGGPASSPMKPSSSGEGSSTERKAAGPTRRGSQRGGARGGARGGGPGRKATADGPKESEDEPAPSEALSSLKSIISQLKHSPGPSNNSSSASSPVERYNAAPPSTSPVRGKQPARGQPRRQNSNSPAPTPTIVPPPPASGPPSGGGLNPQAGGFQPGSLGPIKDMMDEGLVTPTASKFDLMTGMPHPSAPVANAAFAGRQGGFSFPNNAAAQAQVAAQQQMQAQIAALGHAQQQAFVAHQLQLQQFANLGYPGANEALAAATQVVNAPPRFANDQSASDQLIQEQLNIQRQLEQLQLQQQSLIQRFVESQQQQQQQDQPKQHGRRQSGQQSFSGMGNFGQPGTFGTAPASSAAGAKSHARRTSVQVKGNTGAGGAQANVTSPVVGGNNFSPQLSGNNQNAGFGSFGGGGAFTFPPNRDQLNQSTNTNNGEDQYGSGNGSAYGHQRRQSSISSVAGWNVPPSAQAPLAEAQAHLAQLASYRASSGHARVPSFGMSNIQQGGPGPGQLAMAGYGGGLPAPGQQNQMRKSLFAPYLPQASIGPLLAAGKLVMGTLRVNKRNRSDAYVSTDVLGSDVYVCGSKDRNRALEGDVVVVELLEVDEVWSSKKDKELKKLKKEESTSFDPKQTRENRKLTKRTDDVEVEGQGLMLMQDELVTDDQKPVYAGHVVAVVERAAGQLFTGQLGVLRPSSAATAQRQEQERREREGVDLRASQNNGPPQPPPRIVWFRSSDKRVPLIAIPTEQAPPDFVDNADAYADRIFVACIKRWPISSLHPFGTLVEELGQIGDVETETAALLKDCNFSTDEFTDAVLKCLPQTPWTVPERETQPEVRRDLRDERVFTIDPETAKDLDDALHIKSLEDGTFEVGVHIADVSHFVRPNTPLDREARKRATTVYLVQKAVPMLPKTLSEELCSLNPGADKLTFSVIFNLAPDGKVISTWFGKTLINSRVKLAYSDAQEVIDGRDLPAKKETDDRAGVVADIQSLASIARQLRKRRFDENGALRIDNVKVVFGLDEDGMPEDCHAFQRREANELIEEFMLLANMSVAGKIAAGLPDQALLRRHEAPIDRRLDAFTERMQRLGIDLDSSSGGALMKSFNGVTDPAMKATLQHLSTKAMQRAKYFCTGLLDISKFGHYALNVPLYTHFTSPIRRYADVIVHRQLEAILTANPNEGPPRFGLDPEAVSKVAQTCNARKDAAKLAQEQSAHLFLCVLIADLTHKYGPVIREGTVIGVLDEAFDVMVPEFGIEKRVHADNMPTERIVYDEEENQLEIFWKRGVDVLDWLAESQNDAHLRKVRSQAEHHARLMGATDSRAQAEAGLFEDDEEEDEKESEESRRVREKRSKQYAISAKGRKGLVFDEIDSASASQKVRELMRVPVLVTSDMTKSPPVIKVIAVNPFA